MWGGSNLGGSWLSFKEDTKTKSPIVYTKAFLCLFRSLFSPQKASSLSTSVMLLFFCSTDSTEELRDPICFGSLDLGFDLQRMWSMCWTSFPPRQSVVMYFISAHTYAFPSLEAGRVRSKRSKW